MNYVGIYTLFYKEVIRFLKVYNQTLIAPLISALVYLCIFVLAIGYTKKSNLTINNVPFLEFMTSGVIMMSAVQNAFANSSSSLVMSKIMGTIIDYVIPPLPPHGIVIAFTLAGFTRGIMVAIFIFITLLFIQPFKIEHYNFAIFHICAASILLAQLGVLTGLLATNFEQMAAINSYFITPFSFLSGTFYSVQNLPKFLHLFNKCNPFFYMVDGFRYGMIGYHDGNLKAGIIIMSVAIISLHFINYYIFKFGKTIKT